MRNSPSSLFLVLGIVFFACACIAPAVAHESPHPNAFMWIVWMFTIPGTIFAMTQFVKHYKAGN